MSTNRTDALGQTLPMVDLSLDSRPSTSDDLDLSSLSEFSELVDSIYDAATKPELWSSVLQKLADWIGAEASTMFTGTKLPREGGFVFTTKIDPLYIELWQTKYHYHDVWLQSAIQQNKFLSGNCIFGRDLVSPDQFSNATIFTEFLSHHNIFHLLTVAVHGLDSEFVPPVVLSFFRGINARDFDESEMSKARLLVRHVSRATGVTLRLLDAEYKVASSRSALDRLQVGVFLLGSQGHVQFCNRAAQDILEQRDGLRLSVRESGCQEISQLAADIAVSHNELQEAILTATKLEVAATPHFNASVVIPRSSGRAAYVLQCSTLGAENEFSVGKDVACAIVFVTDTAVEMSVDAEILRGVFALTSAEIAVANAMLNHSTVRDVAQEFEVSQETVKSQLKTIYSKLRVDSRTGFVKLMLSLTRK